MTCGLLVLWNLRHCDSQLEVWGRPQKVTSSLLTLVYLSAKWDDDNGFTELRLLFNEIVWLEYLAHNRCSVNNSIMSVFAIVTISLVS